MVSVNLSGGLIVYKEVIHKNNQDYLYMLIRTRKIKGQMNFYPTIKPLKFNKFLVKRLLKLEIGDIIALRGELGFITVREPFPELVPPYISVKKMIIFIKEVEWDRHIDIRETKIDTFIDIINDDYLKELTNNEIQQLEDMLDKKLLE